jgi:hypothetical protein
MTVCWGTIAGQSAKVSTWDAYKSLASVNSCVSSKKNVEFMKVSK